MADRAGGPVAAPTIIVEPGHCTGSHQGLVLHGLGPASMSALAEFQACGGALEEILHVKVDGADGPSVAGNCQLTGAGLLLAPHFPFQPGLAYRATFDPGAIQDCLPQDTVELVFCLPRSSLPSPIVVDHVFPSGDCLPDNLLRFYVCFSSPMQRGHAGAEIMLLGPEGGLAADVLYRPPAELWDPAMRVLTVLLDPGRLKRGVGPNRELGSPLEPGRCYTLVIGEGMTDRFGRRLGAPVHKRFEVGPAAREPVATAAWIIQSPAPGGRTPLVITFPAALDWAMLFNAITVATGAGALIPGHVTIGEMEMQWRFTPGAPWVAGGYQIQVDPGLEDPCGNTAVAAFDRPLRTEVQRSYETGVDPLSFIIA